MKLSARNQLTAKVAEVKRGAVNSEIIAKLGDGEEIRAMVTLESADALGLVAGKEAAFIFKAPNVIVAKGSDLKISVANQLKASVKEVKKGAVNSEVVTTIAGKYEAAAIITNESAEALGINKGDEVTLIVNPSDVIIGA
jgi:molybdate transport system regulatory protein